MRRVWMPSALAIVLLLCPLTAVPAQTPSASLLQQAPAATWVQAAVENELRLINNPQPPLQYRMHRVDARGVMDRIQIESRQGDVARLVERNGRPLTAAENEAEIARLNAILSSPSDFLHHHKRDNSMREQINTLIRELPKSMLLTYTEGQPQRANLPGPQVVVDFQPDPKYKPPTMFTDALTGVKGRVWIDVATKHMVRIEGQFLKTVNFGYGVVARIYPGGTLELEQTNIGGSRWVYNRMVEHLTVRALMVKTMPENSEMTAGDFHLLPAPVDFETAVHQLLAIPVRTQ